MFHRNTIKFSALLFAPWESTELFGQISFQADTGCERTTCYCGTNHREWEEESRTEKWKRNPEREQESERIGLLRLLAGSQSHYHVYCQPRPPTPNTAISRQRDCNNRLSIHQQRVKARLLIYLLFLCHCRCRCVCLCCCRFLCNCCCCSWISAAVPAGLHQIVICCPGCAYKITDKDVAHTRAPTHKHTHTHSLRPCTGPGPS